MTVIYQYMRSTVFLIGLIYIKYAPYNEHINMHDSFSSPVRCGADRATDIGQHSKPKRCLSMTVLSVKLTPSLECHKPAWRHGAASFMKPIPALPQMSHGEFSTASQSLGRQSRKPYYIWGQAPLKLTATAATAKLAERGREREVCSPSLRDNRLNCSQVGLICFAWRLRTQNNALCS